MVDTLTYSILNSLDKVTVHENVILKMIVAFNYTEDCNVNCIGEKMVDCDELTDGGYWLIDAKTKEMYLSDKFLSVFGYDRTYFQSPTYNTLYEFAILEDLQRGEPDLQRLIDKKSQATFVNNVRYKCKDGSLQEVKCSGTVLFVHDEAVLMVGTHELM